METGRAGAIALVVALLLLVFCTCSGIIDSVRNMKVEATANTIRWWTLAVDGIAIAVLAAGGPGFGVGVPELLLLVVPGLVLAVWFVVFFLRVQDELEPVTAR